MKSLLQKIEQPDVKAAMRLKPAEVVTGEVLAPETIDLLKQVNNRVPG